MLRSELVAPPKDRAEVARWILFTLVMTVGVVTAGAVIGDHVWTDDHRADKLRKLERSTLHPCTDGTLGVEDQFCTAAKAVHANPYLNVGVFDTTSTIAGGHEILSAVVAPSKITLDDDHYSPTDAELTILHVDSNKALNVENNGRMLLRYEREPKRLTSVSVKTTKVDLWVHLDPKPSTPYCTKEWCQGIDECDVDVIQDEINHVELVLPCVNGKVGTWIMHKLP